jgi:hypothetical protein
VPLEINPDFTDLEWSGELRNFLITAGQDDKQMCVILEEYRITNPLWYRDIETIMTCNNLTTVLEPDDIFNIILSIKLQNDRRLRERQSGLKGNMEIDAVGEKEKAKEGDK